MMEIQTSKSDLVFLVICALLGLLAELSFFHGEIGISYFLFVTAFYWAFFWRFRGFPFTNRRIGFLLLFCIWLLSAGYFLYCNTLFYALNILVIPVLVILHVILITGSPTLDWYRLSFIPYTFSKLFALFPYNIAFFAKEKENVKTKVDNKAYQVITKIGIGLLISVPLLLIVVNLLSSADSEFSRVIDRLPSLFVHVNLLEGSFRTIVVLLYTFGFFGFLQLLKSKWEPPALLEMKGKPKFWDPVIVSTLLVLINAVYVLFVTIQFQYFFSGNLQDSYTFAEYARRGFFELMAVTMINLTFLIGTLSFSKESGKGIRLFIKVMLTLLVAVSGVMLISAFMRLSLYESAYGYTLARVLPHSFMIFLGVIFLYTLVNVWIERLSLIRFYLISSLVYYTLLNMVNIDQFVVDQNLQRYKDTGKIDIYYLDSLSYTGVDGLLDLYESHPDLPGLEKALFDRKKYTFAEDHSWQSFNIVKRSMRERLQEFSK